MTTGEHTTGAGPATAAGSTPTGTQAGAAAGWYDDPRDPTRLRRWDGRAWSDSWMAKGSGAPAGGLASRAVGSASRSVGPRTGWHPDPTDPSRHRWGDGARWTPRVLTGPVFPERTQLGTGFFVVGRVLVGLLGLNALLGGVAVGVALWSRAVLGRWLEDLTVVDPAEGERYDTVYALLAGVNAVAYLGTGILFIVWLRRAYGSNRVDPAVLRFGAGWTIGAWFVPFLNLVRPFGLVRDLCRALDSRRPGSALAALVPAWWAGFLLMNVVGSVAGTVGGRAADLEPVEALRYTQRWVWIDGVDGVVTLVTAALAGLLVLRVTRALYEGEGTDPLPGPPAEG